MAKAGNLLYFFVRRINPTAITERLKTFNAIRFGIRRELAKGNLMPEDSTNLLFRLDLNSDSWDYYRWIYPTENKHH